MKLIILVTCTIFCVATLAAQSKKVTIFCTISDIGRTDYGKLNRLLPDSLKAGILVDAHKQYGFKKGDDLLLWMTMNGWKLAGTYAAANAPYYVLSRDIYLDGNAYALFLDRLQNVEKRKK